MKFSAPLRLSRKDWIWCLLPLAVWLFLITTRAIWFKPYCNETPSKCTEQSVPWPDRISVHVENSLANQLSFVTQNASGGVAMAAILFLHASRAAAEAAVPAVLWADVGADLLMLAEATLWNGAGVEVARVWVQRPRPFVYKDPEGLGENPSHYTSFYSGHTSFSAAMLALGLLILMIRGAPKNAITFFACLSSGLVFSTALLRVLAGRHFITDVLAGLVFGVMTALAVFALHLRKGQRRPNQVSQKQA